MKIVAISDTHQHPFDNIPDGDVFIHAGDLMNWGSEAEWGVRLQWLEKALKGKSFQKMIYVPGNHDMYVQNYKGPAIHQLKALGVTLLGISPEYSTCELPNGMILGACAYVTNLPTWAFNADEHTIGKFLEAMPRTLRQGAFTLLDSHVCDIMVTHSPPKGVNDELIEIMPGVGKQKLHIGVEEFYKFLKHEAPKHWIHGHVHETRGKVFQTAVGTRVHNAAMLDWHYDVDPSTYPYSSSATVIEV